MVRERKIHRLHLIGDRQAGKTTAALSYAALLIYHGRKVVYYAQDPHSVTHLVHTFKSEHLRLEQQKAYLAHGYERVEDEVTRGVVYFTTYRRSRDHFADSIETVILDDVEHQWDDETISYTHPKVTNIVRTVM